MKKPAFALITLVATLLSLEAALQLLVRVSSTMQGLFYVIPSRIPHERLGFGPNPALPDRDARGFRNPVALDHAEVVALGDSQTAGTGVRPQYAWPMQLRDMTSRTVYSMAQGGWGPTHSLILIEDAFALSPALIIEAFYYGNDLWDSYRLVYTLDKLAALKSTDSGVLAAVSAASRSNTKVEEIDQTDAKPIGAWQRFASTLDEWLDQSLLLDVFDGPLDQFGDVIRGFDALQGMWEMGEWQLAKRQLNGQSGDKVVFDEGDRRTILTPARRHFALNHHDPRILEGLRVSLEAIRLMNEQARERGIDFLVLLIPTKELVYAGDIIELAEIGDQFRRLVEVERFVRDHSQRFFEHHRIEYIDTLPTFASSSTRDPSPIVSPPTDTRTDTAIM